MEALNSCVKFNRLDESFVSTCCKSSGTSSSGGFIGSSQSLQASCSPSLPTVCPPMSPLLADLALPSNWANKSSRACQPRVLETLLQRFAVSAASSFDGIANASTTTLTTGVVDSRFNCTNLPMCHVSS